MECARSQHFLYTETIDIIGGTVGQQERAREKDMVKGRSGVPACCEPISFSVTFITQSDILQSPFHACSSEFFRLTLAMPHASTPVERGPID